MLTAELETGTTAAPFVTPASNWRPGDGVVCPFCGSVNAKAGRCTQCTLDDTPATRAATKARAGFWYVLTDPAVAARGMTFPTLLSLVHRNVVTPESIVRGPSTHQLWRYAGKVKGLSREMGFCYTCGESLGTTAEICPHCNRAQTPPPEADRAAANPAEPAPEAQPVVDPRFTTLDRHAEPAGVPNAPPAGSRRPPRSARTVAGQRYVPPAPEETDAFPAAVEADLPREERPPRRLPREDLLTPSDVARAFSIPFNFTPGTTVPSTDERPRIRPAVSKTTVKITAAVLLSLGAAGLLRSVLTADWVAAATHATIAWADAHLERAETHPAATPFTPIESTEVANAATAAATPSATPARFVETSVPAAATPAAVSLAEPAPAPSPADDVQQLWTTALTAESHRDFAHAVQNYERIRSLPSNAWPASLSTRLQLARQELVAGTY